jgi:hypothetical protein
MVPGRTTPRALATPANLGVGWSCTTHQSGIQPQGDKIVKMQAYLGPNKPETLAVGNGNPTHEFAVVRQDYGTGATRWVGSYPDERTAMYALQAATTHKGFGILCKTREAPASEYTFTNGIPLVVAEDAAHV